MRGRSVRCQPAIRSASSSSQAGAPLRRRICPGLVDGGGADQVRAQGGRRAVRGGGWSQRRPGVGEGRRVRQQAAGGVGGRRPALVGRGRGCRDGAAELGRRIHADSLVADDNGWSTALPSPAPRRCRRRWPRWRRHRRRGAAGCSPRASRQVDDRQVAPLRRSGSEVERFLDRRPRRTLSLMAGDAPGQVTVDRGDVAMKVTGQDGDARSRRPALTCLPLAPPPSSNVPTPFDTLAECTAEAPDR